MAKLVSETPACEFHGLPFLRSKRELWPQMSRDGWKDTHRYGWVCPNCLARNDFLRRMVAKEHPDLPTPEWNQQKEMF